MKSRLIIIYFQADENGKRYELQKMILKTKPMSIKKAQELSIREAEKCWPHYEIEIELNPDGVKP